MLEPMIRPYEILSLPPGLIVVSYDPDKTDPEMLRVDPETWNELYKKGYFGGLIVSNDIKWESIDDKLLADLGLKRTR